VRFRTPQPLGPSPLAWARRAAVALLAVALLLAFGGPGHWAHEALAHASAPAHHHAFECSSEASDAPAPLKKDEPGNKHEAPDDCQVCDLLLTAFAPAPPAPTPAPSAEAPPLAPRTVALLGVFERRSAARPRGPPAMALPAPLFA